MTSPYSNVDYTRALGIDPYTALRDTDPFKGVPPNNAKDYKMFRQHYEEGYYRIMMNIPPGMSEEEFNNLPKEGKFTLSAACEWTDESGQFHQPHKIRPQHFGSMMMWACPHVTCADPVNPEGVVCIPFRRDLLSCYFLCLTCFKHLEQCKFKFDDKSLMTKCGACVSEAVEKVRLRHPDRFRDLRFDGALPYQL